ncbi:hypothetical protein ACFQH6_20710 [Halobacteriaceae archaeon GCM10025711]
MFGRAAATGAALASVSTSGRTTASTSGPERAREWGVRRARQPEWNRIRRVHRNRRDVRHFERWNSGDFERRDVRHPEWWDFWDVELDVLEYVECGPDPTGDDGAAEQEAAEHPTTQPASPSYGVIVAFFGLPDEAFQELVALPVEIQTLVLEAA